MDFNFNLNYIDDRKEDNSSITTVITQFLSVFYPIFLEVQLTSRVPLNKIQGLLLLHNSAVERHFLLAFPPAKSRQSNAEALRAVKVQPLIH